MKRGIAMVFQSYALYPHMTVFENIAFPLRVERLPEDEVDGAVGAAAEMLQLEQRLRAAARARCPAASASASPSAAPSCASRRSSCSTSRCPTSTRRCASEMRVELMGLHKRLGSTMVYVTHDQVEAMTMADKIVVLNARAASSRSAARWNSTTARQHVRRRLHRQPEDEFRDEQDRRRERVARSPSTSTGSGTLRLPRSGDAGLVGKPATLGIRPEHLTLGGGGPFELTLTPGIIERLGIHTLAYCKLASGADFVALFEGEPDIAEGRAFKAGVDPAKCHLFDTDGLAVSEGR